MSKITAIPREKTVNQSDNTLKCFVPYKIDSCLQNYENIIHKLKNAEKSILIASAEGINDEILEAVYIAISKNVRVYIVLKLFKGNENILIKFDKNKPAIIREVSELENNFLIIDGKGTLLFNSLSNDNNNFIPLDEKKSQDLTYWFNYYFWNHAKQEKIVDKIDIPKDSPYPPFFSQKETISLQTEKITNIDKTIVPCNKKYQNTVSNCEHLFLSRDITTPIHFSNYETNLGQLKISDNLFDKVGATFELCEVKLGNIKSEIIPFDEDNWNKTFNIENQKTDNLATLTANSIEDMENTFPKNYPEHKYFLKIKYEWEVVPPTLPKNAKKSKLYEQFKIAQEKLQKDLSVLERELNGILQKNSTIISFFMGAKRKAKEKLKEVSEWRNIDLGTLNFNELKDVLKQNGKFEKFYTSIVKDAKKFRVDVDKKEKETSWKERKLKKEKLLDTKRKELNDIITDESNTKEKIVQLDKEIDNIKKEIDKEKTEQHKIEQELNDINIDESNTKEKIVQLEKEIDNIKEKIRDYNKSLSELKNKEKSENNHLKKLLKKLKIKKSEVDSIKLEIEKKYTHFVYTESKNELLNLKKNSNSNDFYTQFNIPQYVLPEVGTLFEDRNNYFLQIEMYEDLKKANEIAKNRYIEKPCKVVAKGETK